MDSESDARLQRLRIALAELQELLGAFDEERWSTWFARCQTAVDVGDPTAFREILRAFGGMGSFNDLVLSRRVKGLRSSAEIALQPRGWTDEERVANARLREIGSVIWREATTLDEAFREKGPVAPND